MNILDLLYPKKCVACGKKGKYFCSNCITKITSSLQICPVCEKLSPLGTTHLSCQKPFSLDGLFSFFQYTSPVKNAIHKLKYKLVTNLFQELWKIILKEIQNQPNSLSALNQFIVKEQPLLTFIPLYWYKENSRGFNQAHLFCQHFASLWNLKYQPTLIRTKNTISQTKLNLQSRKQNVKGIFQPIPNLSLPSKIIIVDDVWTTGSTLKEAAQILKKAGVKKIWGLTIAR